MNSSSMPDEVGAEATSLPIDNSPSPDPQNDGEKTSDQTAAPAKPKEEHKNIGNFTVGKFRGFHSRLKFEKATFGYWCTAVASRRLLIPYLYRKN